ncbi:hypothetical protein HD599_001226 [Conyzicola lurida]|uniref:Uncharacterized protein n=1 Tax=Conyzicola lurida TaxID=1172621 RepID=A0A841AMP2_9MICO|nr:hypothetical protein [Conyzicola lurida]MBB5842903.1 hypothetical protein [Conyzicola lurida]
MIERTAHGRHGHTVTEVRWTTLKADYARRCSSQLAVAAEHRAATLRRQATEIERDRALSGGN